MYRYVLWHDAWIRLFITSFADCATDAPRAPGADVPIAEEEDAMDTT